MIHQVYIKHIRVISLRLCSAWWEKGKRQKREKKKKKKTLHSLVQRKTKGKIKKNTKLK